MNATTPQQAAMSLLTIVCHNESNSEGRLALLNQTLLHDLDEIETLEGRCMFLVEVAAHLAVVAAGLTGGSAALLGCSVDDMLASIAAAVGQAG